MTIGEALAAVGILGLDDRAFSVACGGCDGEERSLDASDRRESDGRTEYVCSTCGSVLVMVGHTSLMPGGFRLGNAFLLLPMGRLTATLPDGHSVDGG